MLTRELAGYEVTVALDSIFDFNAEIGYGLIIATAPGEFVGAGSGFREVPPKTPGPATVGILAVDEGQFRDGRWIQGRRLNGDENDQGKKWRFDPRRIVTSRGASYTGMSKEENGV